MVADVFEGGAMIRLVSEAILWDDAQRTMREPVQAGLRRLLTTGYLVKEDEQSVSLAHELRPILNYTEADADYTNIPKVQIVQRQRIGVTIIVGNGEFRAKGAKKRVRRSPANPTTAASTDGESGEKEPAVADGDRRGDSVALPPRRENRAATRSSENREG
jgi:hypothetical protein